MLKIGFFGPQGTFSEEAARRFNQDKHGELTSYETIFDLFKALESGEIDEAVMPMENSLEGSVSATMDLLAEASPDIKIMQEIDLRIEHHLIARKDLNMSQVCEIISHPQALAQCRKFLYQNFPSCPTHQASSTARAVEMITRPHYESFAAIASKLTLEHYPGLKILADNISDFKNNQTRFVVLAKKQLPKTSKDKTSILFRIAKDYPGGLYSVLGSLKNINLTRIESRPNKTGIGDYIFFIDMEGHESETRLKRALQQIQKKVQKFKILGAYPVSRHRG